MSTVSAAQAVGEFLQSPDDLMKTAQLRKKLEKEKASIDTKLGGGVRDQLDAIRDGLRKLISTRENVNALKEEIRSIEALLNDDKNEVKTFDQISRVSGSLTTDDFALLKSINPFRSVGNVFVLCALLICTLHTNVELIRFRWCIEISLKPVIWSPI